MQDNRLTHTVTHTRKCPDRPKEYRRGGFASSPVFLSSFCSHDLRHKVAHCLCGLVLLLPGGVGVGAECESGIVVAQHAADGFDVHAVLQCQRGEGVSEVVKAYVRQSCILQNFLMQVYNGVWVVHLAGDGRREHIRVVWMLLVLGDQQVDSLLWNADFSDRLQNPFPLLIVT